MKFVSLLFTAIVLAACASSHHTYRVPQGYQTCTSDVYCPPHYYCTFVGVDTYAVCKPR